MLTTTTCPSCGAALGPQYDRNLTTEQTAAAISVPANTLKFWRQQGTGPRYIKAGRRVLYRQSDLDEWMSEQRQTA